MIKKITMSHLWLIASVIILAIGSRYATYLFTAIEHGPEPHLVTALLIMGFLFILGGASHYVTLPNQIPSFVAAIAFGIAAQPFLSHLVANKELVAVIVTAIVAYILFGGGLETKWEDFKQLLMKICSLSFLGLFVTALLFSGFVWVAGWTLGYPVSITSAVLLGTVLASTDPAAIIPAFKVLRLKNPKLKDIAIAESALTDVTGTLLTVTFVTMLGSGIEFQSVASAYDSVFTSETAAFLGKQTLWGLLMGVAGYLSIEFLHKRKRGERNGLLILWHRMTGRSVPGENKGKRPEYEADTAFFFSLVILACAIAITLGGSGYLAAFIAGLLLGTIEEHLGDTEAYFNRSIEGFLKPMIFILLGAMVDIQAMIAYAPIDIVAAFVFMFVIRPFAVFLSLGPWLGFAQGRMNVKELLFLSFVRETGAIPAALIIALIGQGHGDIALLSIGMWVILATLIILPPLTPAVAQRLGVAV